MYDTAFAPTRKPSSYASELKTVAVLGATLFLSSTGGNFSTGNMAHWLGYVKPKISLIIDEPTQTGPKADVRSVAVHLTNIRNVLSPTMSELAVIFGVSRQAVYKWLSEESTPDDQDKMSLIRNLSLVADKLSDSGVAKPGSLIKMRAFEGNSLIDIIRQKGNWETAVEVLISEDQAMSEAYAKSKIAESKTAKNDDWLSSESIPGSTEN
ncbi:XRE family transcriptional regulator [Serratia marcescens]|uniref:XRE family transcriptional regulator n=1 Tax=Serratia marcescens TaxID=615 RepID=UPI003FA763A7